MTNDALNAAWNAITEKYHGGHGGAEYIVEVTVNKEELAEAIAAYRAHPQADAPAASPGEDGLRAALRRLVAAANNLAAEVSDPGTEALAAIWCAERLLDAAAPGDQAVPEDLRENIGSKYSRLDTDIRALVSWGKIREARNILAKANAALSQPAEARVSVPGDTEAKRDVISELRESILGPEMPQGASVSPRVAEGWRTIDSAPKSTHVGRDVRGIYLLGFCPDDAGSDPQQGITVIWWEPLTEGGVWYGGDAMKVRPTHWAPLLKAPAKETTHE